MCYNAHMNGIWTSQGETVKVWVEGPDEDGDYEVWPDGNEDAYASWTVYASELASGAVRLEIF